MIADQIAHVSMLESSIPVRLRTFDHNGQPSVVATPAGTNGHLLNRRPIVGIDDVRGRVRLLVLRRAVQDAPQQRVGRR